MLEKEEVVSQRFNGLKRQPNHHPGPHLIARFAQAGQALPSLVVRVVGRVQAGIKGRVGGFDTQQITVCTGLKPTAVGFESLFAQRKRNPQFTLRHLLDSVQEPFDTSDKRLVGTFSGLYDHRAVPCLPGILCCSEHLSVGQFIPFHGSIPAPDAAIEAILPTTVREFDKPSQMHPVTHRPIAYLYGTVEKCPVESQIPQRSTELFHDLLSCHPPYKTTSSTAPATVRLSSKDCRKVWWSALSIPATIPAA